MGWQCAPIVMVSSSHLFIHSYIQSFTHLLVAMDQAEDDVIRSGILEITDKPSVVLLSAIAMAMDLQEDAAPADRNTLAMEVPGILYRIQ